MTGFLGYQIEIRGSYQRYFDSLEKKHYGKKARPRDKQEFRELVFSFLKSFESEGDAPVCHGQKMEFPKKVCSAGFLLYKKSWAKLPGLEGKSKCGRLIYLECTDQRLILPLCIYTHAEWEKQLSAKELTSLIVEAQAWVTTRGDYRVP